jgi:hypothetical protein
VDVAELVPEVPLREALGVGALEQQSPADGFEQQEVRGLGLVPSGQQTVDRPDAPFGGDDEVGPAVEGPDDPAVIGS